MFLSDHETEVDLLYYEAIAKTVVKLIRQTPEAPVTIGVHGDWGAGKSSVLKMTAASFAGDKRVLCLWFNGWAFEGFEDAKAVVIETIVDELKRARSGVTKVADAARKVLKRIDWLKLAKKAGGLAFTATTGIPTLDQIKGLYDTAMAILGKPQEHITAADLKSIADQAGDYLKDAEADGNVPAQMHAFREEFEELLAAADIDQLVVLIDDLDRCLPETAIATLEAIRLFLFVPCTAFVVAADEAMIEYAVRQHFPDLPLSTGPASHYARNYLEKLIQVPFRIPALGLAETRAYVTLLLVQNELGEKDERFTKLLAAAREELRRPWESRGLDRTTIHTVLGEVPPEIDQALQISAQITHILTDGTRGNPRQIKRFLNSMALRFAIAEERGFDREIKRPVLAKIMLAERFSPDFYEQVARLAAGAPTGKPAALAHFEDTVRDTAQHTVTDEKASRRDGRKAKADPVPVDVDIEEWLKSDWARGWAAIDPPLKNEDLRPYVFVTRDKRSYFGGLATASHLEALVDRLMGASLAIRGAEAEIGRLSGTEAEQVFDALRDRILQSDNLETAPNGAAGLAALVRLQPALQRRLLSFVRALPLAKVGAWAATGWSRCFTDANIGKRSQGVKFTSR
jgi:predicted KAP-like P-loop ATPase